MSRRDNDPSRWAQRLLSTSEKRAASFERRLARERAASADLRKRLKDAQVWMMVARNECRSAQRQIERGDNLRQGDSAHYQVSEAIDSLVLGLRLSRRKGKA